MSLLLKDKIVQINSEAAYCEIVHPRERLEVVHAIPTKHNILDVFFYIVHEALLFGHRAASESPRLTKARLIRR